MLGPIITKAKIFIQRLWLFKLTLDDVLSDKEVKKWKRFPSKLKILNGLETEICILTANPILIEIHGLADACEVAYGEVIYYK